MSYAASASVRFPLEEGGNCLGCAQARGTMPERDKRRAALKAQELELHALYMATDIGSQDERALELALDEIMVELDAIYLESSLEECAEWGKNDDRALREKLADTAYGTYR